MTGFFNSTHQYDDIIDLPHHVSGTRPRMSAHDRAAQFSPFAALTGFGAAITETARRTEEKIELDEQKKAELDERLRFLQGRIGSRPEADITYFRPDARKSGGAYVTVRERVKRIDLYRRQLLLEDGRAVALDDILRIDIL